MPTSNQVRRLRLEAGLSLDELAAQTGLAKSSLSLLERGMAEPMLSTARKISAALHADLDQVWPHTDD